ncbi:MAG TPA: hypothetical protein VME17_03100 [Bryobacteraceae bacterium]|nr:hypothetical protein [Bryobacteraceae bacterium]
MPSQSDPSNSTPLNQPRLWFGSATGACCWLGLLTADLLLAWKTCRELPNGLDTPPLGWAIYLFAAVTVALLAVTIVSGLVSYRNFRRLSPNASLWHSEATGREEFMALAGVFVSVVLGIGIVWLSLPLMLLRLCMRAR